MGRFDKYKKPQTAGRFDKYKKEELEKPVITQDEEPLGPPVVEASPPEPSVIASVFSEVMDFPEPKDYGKPKPGRWPKAPAQVVEAKRVPESPGSKKIIEYFQMRPGERPSAVALIDRQKKAREVFDAFGGSKKDLHSKIRWYAKDVGESSQWADNRFAEIVNFAEALPEGARVGDELDVSIPQFDPITGLATKTKLPVSPLSTLEGLTQFVASIGGGDLDVNESRKVASKAGQITGDVAEIALSLGSTMSLGKTLLKSSSAFTRRIGGLLYNPDTNPIPDVMYAATEEGDFSQNFLTAYAVNLAIGRLIGGKDALKALKELPEGDRAILRENLETALFEAKKKDAQKVLGITDGEIKAMESTLQKFDEATDVVQMARAKKTTELAEKMTGRKVVKEQPLVKEKPVVTEKPKAEVVEPTPKPKPEVEDFEPQSAVFDDKDMAEMQAGLRGAKVTLKDMAGAKRTEKPVKPEEAPKPDLTPVEKDEPTGFRKIVEDGKNWIDAFGVRDKIRNLNRKKVSRIKGQSFRLFEMSRRFQKVIKKEGIDPERVNELLKNPELRRQARVEGEISTELLDTVDEVRDVIDFLSRQLKEDGKILSEKLEAVVDDNLELYLKRSYRKFYERNWWKKVKKDTDVIEGARKWIDEAYGEDIMRRLEAEHAEVTPELYNEAINAEIKAIATDDWDAESMGHFTKWLGDVNRDNLKARKSIPLPIRRLMGEIDDPVTNSILTAQNMITQIEQSRVNKAIIDKFMAGGDNPVIFRQKHGEFDTPIKIDTGFGHKETLYTTKEYAKEFKEDIPRLDMMNLALMRANGMLKGLQTVWNPKSHIRNFRGNTYLAMASGHWRVNLMKDAFDITIRKSENKELVEELMAEGLLSSDVITQNLQELAKGRVSYMMKDVDKATIDKLQKAYTDLPDNIMQKLYQWEDDVWKVYGYLNERARGYSKKDAIANARLIYPNYANLPRWQEKMRSIPYIGSMIGTFTAFPTAMIQSSGHIVKLAAKEMAGETALGKRSFTRALGVGTVTGVYLGRHKFNDMVNSIRGDGEPFEQYDMSTSEVADMIQKYGSPWEHNAQLNPTRVDENGYIEYVNMSYTNPFSVVSEPLDALAKGEVFGAMGNLLQPYTDPSMLASMIQALFTGEDDMGNKVYDLEGDEIYNNVGRAIIGLGKRISPWMVMPDLVQIKADLKAGEFDMSKVIPGLKQDAYVKGVGYEAARWQKAADQVVDEYGRGYSARQEIRNFFTGTRRQTFVPEQAIKSNLFTVKDAWNKSMRNYMSKLYNENSRTVIKMYHEEGEKRRQDVFNQMREIVTDFKKFGLDEKEIRTIMNELRITKGMQHMVFSGKYRPFRPSENTVNAMMKAREKRGLSDFDFDL